MSEAVLAALVIVMVGAEGYSIITEVVRAQTPD
jgi:hypothetical protein